MTEMNQLVFKLHAAMDNIHKDMQAHINSILADISANDPDGAKGHLDDAYEYLRNIVSCIVSMAPAGSDETVDCGKLKSDLEEFADEYI